MNDRHGRAVPAGHGLIVPMLSFTLLYIALGAIVATLMASLVRETR